MAPRCSRCSFDPSSISPADAVVALRSFPRRFRELADEPLPGPAAVQAGITSASSAIAALGADLRRVLVGDHPQLTTTASAATTTTTSTSSDGGGGGSAVDVDGLAASVAAVVDLAERQPASAWARSGTRPGAPGPVTAHELLGEAVHAGVHHLKVAEAAG